MRVLITRAMPHAQATAARVAALGHEPIVSPVLEIENLAFDFDASGVQALLFSSVAAVVAFGACDAPALVVGEATAEAARAAGFPDVRSADGAGADLVALARGLDPAAGALVHVSGEDIATDLVAALAEAGFSARRLIVYRARMTGALTRQAAQLLTNPAPGDSALFHSARGAESFGVLVRAAGLQTTLRSMRALCLSQRIASVALSLDFKQVRVADAPRESALLALLGNTSSERA
jgi:uroporphyrinogen-III synthase